MVNYNFVKDRKYSKVSGMFRQKAWNSQPFEVST